MFIKNIRCLIEKSVFKKKIIIQGGTKKVYDVI
jgi:hypothetical protein